ncbi:hypothetical protein M407DRAFT_19116 [Tulasnella calospora MUT 4182]|uniref:Uncharacterized protein n=1 Tax=Tulasnella calospora MUT 4182 TaxID=1051891 RepID=A0A0C3MDN6_9AGAM|nr:hypothetical protein M407DRAFT_19116 [Tulasnella calospora MUT 4182]
MAGTRYFLTLHNLQQAGDVEFTIEYVESGKLHQASWGCYIHSGFPSHANDINLDWASYMNTSSFSVNRVNNLIYRNVAPFTFIGTGSNRVESKDDAARNALRGLGFNFANVL